MTTRADAIDVWILGGYLGAGKTTTLNALLRSPEVETMNPALIINEFGRIGVDGALVERRDLTRYEINKGSLFCACTRTDFLRVLEQIADAETHGALFIEATGIAEPVDIEDLLARGSRPGRFRLCGNICVVDASGFTQVAAFLKPAVEQVKWADVLVVNKCDLVDDREREVLHRVLEGINGTAPRRETEHGGITMDVLLDNRRGSREGRTHRGIDTRTPAAAAAGAAAATTAAAPYPSSAPPDIFALSFTSGEPIEEHLFSRVLSELGEHILRLKGNVAFAGKPAYLEVICGRETRRDPEQNLSDQFGVPTVFTVIAWNTDPSRVRSAFSRCGCVG